MFGALLLAPPASAQEDVELDEDPPAAAEAPAEAPAEGEATAAPQENPQTPQVDQGPSKADAGETVNVEGSAAIPDATEGGDTPVLGDGFTEQKNGFIDAKKTSSVEWHGGLELDVGYARWTFQNEIYSDEDYHDFRGRFVLGPTLQHDFAGDWFVRARGEMVAWVREAFGQYQVNVDDVWGQVGKTALWDLKVGRFQTWRVYHKGMGFDLYTLEDTGAMVQNTYEASPFGPHTYEANFIYYRETPGRAAVHLYPTDFLGFEAVASYGKAGTVNVSGGRFAGVFHIPYVRVSAAGEYSHSRPAIKNEQLDPATGVEVECVKCGTNDRFGFAGGVELTIKPVEIGLNVGRGTIEAYSVKDELIDNGASGTNTSMGGYAELDAGSLVLDRSLIFGVGFNRAEWLADNDNFQQQDQGAAYIVYPLGFDQASLKLVASMARLSHEPVVNGIVDPQESDMSSIRMRLTYPF